MVKIIFEVEDSTHYGFTALAVWHNIDVVDVIGALLSYSLEQYNAGPAYSAELVAKLERIAAKKNAERSDNVSSVAKGDTAIREGMTTELSVTDVSNGTVHFDYVLNGVIQGSASCDVQDWLRFANQR